MSKTTFVSGSAVICFLVAAACSGDDGSGLLPNLDGALPDGGATGGASSGTGGKNTGGGSGASTGGSGTGGAAASGGAGGGSGGADASSPGTGGDSGKSDASADGAADSAPDAKADGASPGAPGCPAGGYYTIQSSGSGCGDLDNAAPSQRLDADTSRCNGRFEYDNGGGKGVSSGTLTFAFDGGALAASQVQVGSATMSCTGQGTTKSVSLSCSGDAGSCTIELDIFFP